MKIPSFIDSRLAVASLIAAMLFVVMDISRFVNQGLPSNNRQVVYEIPSVNDDKFMAEIRSKLQGEFVDKHKPKKMVKKSSTDRGGSSNKSQIKQPRRQIDQTGFQSIAYTDKYDIQLKAVLTEAGSVFTLLHLKDLKTNKQNVRKFSNHAEIDGYKIRVINNLQVDLINTAEQRTINLVMYKKATK